jgi:hypothetical protein
MSGNFPLERKQEGSEPDDQSTVTVYASIGNSDDKLSQRAWAAYLERFRTIMRTYSATVFGDWVSESSSRYQNACMCIEVAVEQTTELSRALTHLREFYRQDSIAFTVVDPTGTALI